MVDEATRLERESESIETSKCGREVCPKHVYEGATVDVVVGKVERKENGQSGISYLVSGIESGHPPEIEKWCLECSQSVFNVEKSAGERPITEENRFLTPENLAFFLAGVILTLTSLSMFLL